MSPPKHALDGDPSDGMPDHLTAAGDLELEDISLNIGGRWALERLSLAIRPGEVTALSGPSGSGKTTLLSIAGGILKPTTGFASPVGTCGRATATRGTRSRSCCRSTAWCRS